MKNASEIKLNSTYILIAVFCGFIIIGFVFGGRHSFGFLMRPITLDPVSYTHLTLPTTPYV